MKVLLIEDEKTLAYEVERFLKKAFYICDLAHNAADGVEKMDNSFYDFILLDLGLPDMDGLEVLRRSKDLNPDAACIVLTARGNIEDRVKGLDLGADDYLPKPFSLMELQSRMQAISRRKAGSNSNISSIGEFNVDLRTRIVTQENNEIELTRKEFDILSYLLINKNRVLTRLQLSEHIWGTFADDDYDSNYIDGHIKNIRKKMGHFGDITWLETVRGVGYKIRKA